ncbi:MAG: tryptophan 7-halogenase [Phycisphaerales bacterium]|nr:tryptophan 7-halogenase [Phycisphaerales bacterium]
MSWDVVIVGGGPAGSTAGSLLRKYNPRLNVLILEKEQFPREHVGESQLPLISFILEEMGCWDKVEAAGFPIKIGATYRWGQSNRLWDFEFYPAAHFRDEPRPAKFEGQRRMTAFQVDRALYDQILLDHARSMGCDARERTPVREVLRDPLNPDRIAGLRLESGEVVEGRYYIDGSGGAGLLRRAMDIEVDCPTTLRNIAMWDYWTNTDWAVSIGVGGTRVQVLSLGYGWIWFIPLSPTRTSIGFVTHADYYKSCGLSPGQLYEKAINDEPRVRELIRNASRDGEVRTTKDWSFVARRMTGENWFLTGEAAGFADPILAGGLTLTQSGARECAYTILELEKGRLDRRWLLDTFDETQRTRIRQHIRFADFWYAGNGQFPDLQEYTTQIARDAGLRLNPQQAFRWLSTGGFAGDQAEFASFGTFDLGSAKQVISMFVGRKPQWLVNSYNVFRLNLEGATRDLVTWMNEGEIRQLPRFRRGDTTLALIGMFAVVVEALRRHSGAQDIIRDCLAQLGAGPDDPDNMSQLTQRAVHVLEAMLTDGWIWGTFDRKLPTMTIEMRRDEGGLIRPNQDALTVRLEGPGVAAAKLPGM